MCFLCFLITCQNLFDFDIYIPNHLFDSYDIKKLTLEDIVNISINQEIVEKVIYYLYIHFSFGKFVYGADTSYIRVTK